MAKTQVLEYTIHLRDRTLAEQLAADLASLTPTELTGAVLVYPGGGKIGILRAPSGGADIEFAQKGGLYPPALPIVEVGGAIPTGGVGYITSSWFDSGSSAFPRNVATFTKSSGWWIFGSNTKFYWAGQVQWSPDVVESSEPPAGVTEPTEPAVMPQRIVMTGFDLGGNGDPLEGLTSSGSSGLVTRKGAAIQSYGMVNAINGSGTQFAGYSLAGLTQRGHWERFYYTPLVAGSDASGVWRGFNFSTNGSGFSVEILPSLQLAFKSWTSTVANTLLATSTALTLGTRYKFDTVFDVDGTGNTITCSVYLNGALLFSGSVTAGGLLANRYHQESRLGKEQSVTTSAVGAFDNWIISKIPSTKDPAIAAYNPATAYVLGDVVNVGGIRYKAKGPTTGNPPGGASNAFWIRLTDPIDWIQGSRLVRLKPSGFSVSTNWTGDFRVLLQRPDPVAAATITSTTSGALVSVTTDMTRLVDGLPGAVGWAALQVNAFTKRAGVANGSVGYQIGAAAPVDTTIVETAALAWKGVIYAPTNLASPIPPGTAVIMRYTKAADATLASLAILEGTVEAIGVFGSEDIVEGSGVEATPPQVFGGVHNAYVPDSPFAKDELPIGPIVVVGGTYTGNGTGQDLLFKAPPTLLLIRALTGSAGGPFWWPSLLGGHISANQGILFEQPIADVDQDLSYVQADPNADQQLQFRVRLGGAGAPYNQGAVSYQYIAFCDPAARFSRAGVGVGSSLNAPLTVALDDPEFLGEWCFLWREGYDTVTTDAFFAKGPGNASDAISQIGTATTLSPGVTFGTGALTFGSALFNAMHQYPFLLFRAHDGNNHPDEAKVMFKGTYTGDGSASRTITVGSTGFRPLWAIVTGVTSTGVRYRDPSHTGTNSENPTSGANDATLGITAGGLDSFTVGTNLNANGVVYNYIGFYANATAGNNGWGVNGEYTPVPADSRKPSDWSEPVELVVVDPIVTPGVDPGDLTTDIASTCVAASTRLCNLALSRIGVTKVLTSLATDVSEEATNARLVYKTEIDATLRDFPWPFATRYATLTLIDGSEDDPVNGDWDFSYRAPTNSLFVRRIVHPDEQRGFSRTPIPFRMTTDDTGDVVLCNEPGRRIADGEDVTVEYTLRLDCPARFGDPIFRSAAAWRLAAALVAPLSRDIKLVDYCEKRYQQELARARTVHAREQEQQQLEGDGDAEWIGRRGISDDPDWITRR